MIGNSVTMSQPPPNSPEGASLSGNGLPVSPRQEKPLSRVAPLAAAVSASTFADVDPALAKPRLSTALREHTRDLHTEAECSGIVQAILEGSVGRADYALFLRNLLPAYETMERELCRHYAAPALCALTRAEIFRAPALITDLETLAGAAWWRDLPLLPAGREYAARIAHAAADDPALLIAHAYVRYLGDLNGGRLLKKRLARYEWLPAGAVAFYEFPEISDISGFIAAYRAAIDRAAALLPSCAGVIAEAAIAFRLNIAVSKTVLAAAA